MQFKASKFAPEDVINIMPDNVVTNILDRLPIQDAVRTSILSRNWRSKWTMLTQLIFDDKFYEYLLKTKSENSYGRIISRILLHLKGVITKFFLYIEEPCYSKLDAGDINHWILFLSEKGIRDLTIEKWYGPPLKLPTHLFSCLELKHLKLVYCCFSPPASFHCFPNLLSLDLRIVEFESGKFGEFFTRCPVLENLNMAFPYTSNNVKHVEIAKLANLKILSLFLCNLDNTTFTSSGSILELVSFLPKLQELDLDFRTFKLTEGVAKERFPTTFPGLKTLKLSRIDLNDGIKISCAFEMIMSFPDLQTLEINAYDEDGEQTPTSSAPKIDYNATGQLQLRSVVFRYSTISENEVCLIKYILACSPFLEKIVIHPNLFIASNGKFMFARKLVKLHRASPVVDIDLR